MPVSETTRKKIIFVYRQTKMKQKIKLKSLANKHELIIGMSSTVCGWKFIDE